MAAGRTGSRGELHFPMLETRKIRTTLEQQKKTRYILAFVPQVYFSER